MLKNYKVPFPFDNASSSFFFSPSKVSLFQVQSSGVCIKDIVVADSLYRKKRKTNMQLPTLEKISCSYTGKELVSSPTELSLPMSVLTGLSGQNCTVVWAKKSVSSWKLRKNSVIGCKVTLRRRSACIFLDKLIVYGEGGIFKKKNHFSKSFIFDFGVAQKSNFIELQKWDRLDSGFSGFSISIN